MGLTKEYIRLKLKNFLEICSSKYIMFGFSKIVTPEIITSTYKQKITKVMSEDTTACDMSREILNTDEHAMEYIKEHHSSIGTDIHRNNTVKCGLWNVKYFLYLDDLFHGEVIVPEPEIAWNCTNALYRVTHKSECYGEDPIPLPPTPVKEGWNPCRWLCDQAHGDRKWWQIGGHVAEAGCVTMCYLVGAIAIFATILFVIMGKKGGRGVIIHGAEITKAGVKK